MAILSLSLATGVLTCVSVGLLCSRAYFGVSSNRAFAIGSPEINPPRWHPKIGSFLALSFSPLLVFVCASTEAWMAMYLLASPAPLMLIPFLDLFINALQWLLSLVCGNAQGDGSHKDPTGAASTRNGAPPVRWPPNKLLPDIRVALKRAGDSVGSWADMMWHGRTWSSKGLINCNHSLMCYLQSESLTEMHNLDQDVLQEFPSASPKSRANAVMMARCAMLAYDRWHNVEQVINDKWNSQLLSAGGSSARKYEMLHAWTFDRVPAPSCMESQKAPVKDHSQQVKAESSRTVRFTPFDRSLPDILESGRQDTVCEATWVAAAAAAAAAGTGTTDDDMAATEAIRTCVASGSTPVDSPASLSFHQAAAALAAALSGVQKLVTNGKQLLRNRIFQWLKRLVWRYAGAGEPDAALPDGQQYASLKTNAFLMRVSSDNREPMTGAKVVALVLAFSGSGDDGLGSLAVSLFEATQPPDTLDPAEYPLGYTHTAFRDSLGLVPNLDPGSGLEGFSCSYLDYRPCLGSGQSSEFSRTYQPKKPTQFRRIQQSPTTPFQQLHQGIAMAIHDMGPGVVVKVFVTGHSIGGALAHLFTGATLLNPLYCSSTMYNDFESLYTFGAPRVGDQIWVSKVEDVLKIAGRANTVDARFFRVVNAMDPVPRTPPTMGGTHQHPGHCVYIKPGFLISTPSTPAAAWGEGAAVEAAAATDLTNRAAAGAARQDRTSTAAASHAHSHIVRLTETPEITLTSAAVSVTLKAVLSVLLLSSALLQISNIGKAAVVVAATTLFWPLILTFISCVALLAVPGATAMAGLAIFWVMFPEAGNQLITVLLNPLANNAAMLGKALVQHRGSRPRLASNPMYAVLRVGTLLGPALIVLLLDVLLLPCVALVPILWWTILIEPVLLLLMFVYMPPVLTGCWLDHAMGEYYTACWLSTAQDWGNTQESCGFFTLVEGAPKIIEPVDQPFRPSSMAHSLLSDPWGSDSPRGPGSPTANQPVRAPPQSMSSMSRASDTTASDQDPLVQGDKDLMRGALEREKERWKSSLEVLLSAANTQMMRPDPHKPMPHHISPFKGHQYPGRAGSFVSGDTRHLSAGGSCVLDFLSALCGGKTAHPALNGMGADDSRALLLTPKLLTELQECSDETALLVADKLAELGYYPLLDNDDGLIIGTATFLKQLQSSNNEPAASAAYAASSHAASGPPTTSFAPHSMGQARSYAAVAGSSSSAAGSSGGQGPTGSQPGGGGGGGAGAGGNGGSDAGNNPPQPDSPRGQSSAGSSSSRVCMDRQCVHRLTIAIPTGEEGVQCYPVDYGKSCTVNFWSKQNSSSEGKGKNSSVLGDGSEDRWDFLCQVKVDVCRHEGCEDTDKVFVKVHRARAERSEAIQPVPSRWHILKWIKGTDRCWCLSSTLFTFRLEALSTPGSVQTRAGGRTVQYCLLSCANENMGPLERLETPPFERDISRVNWLWKINPQVNVGKDNTGIQGVSAEQQKERMQLASQEKPRPVESVNLQPSGQAFHDPTLTAKTMELQRHVLNTAMCKEGNTWEAHLGVLDYESPPQPPVIYHCTRINNDDAVQLRVGMKLEAVYLRVPKAELADPNIPAVRVEPVSMYYEKQVCLTYDVCTQHTLHATAPARTITVGTAAPASPTVVTPGKLPP